MKFKSFFIAILLGIISVLLFLFSQQQKEISELRKNQPKPPTICINYSQIKPSTLKHGVISDMIQTYENIHRSTMKTNLGRNNVTKSVLFHIDTLEKFIYDIKEEVRLRSDDPKSENLGLRLYLGAYPDNVRWGTTGYEDLAYMLTDSVKKKYQHRLTAVFIPVRTKADNTIIDFNPIDKKTYENSIDPFVLEKGEIPTQKPEFNYMIMAMAGNTIDDDPNNQMARNHGTLDP